MHVAPWYSCLPWAVEISIIRLTETYVNVHLPCLFDDGTSVWKQYQHSRIHEQSVLRIWEDIAWQLRMMTLSIGRSELGLVISDIAKLWTKVSPLNISNTTWLSLRDLTHCSNFSTTSNHSPVFSLFRVLIRAFLLHLRELSWVITVPYLLIAYLSIFTACSSQPRQLPWCRWTVAGSSGQAHWSKYG